MKKKTTVQEYESQLSDKFMPPKDESKEVKEGGELFTGGQWVKSHKEANSYSIHAGLIELAVVTGEMGSDAVANACLFEQSKNMHYALKDFMKVVEGISSVPTGSKLTVTIDASVFENASNILLKTTPKK